MKFPSLRAAVFSVGSLLCPLAALAADHGFVSLFNGRDLTGWDGNADFWSVRDGALTGQTTSAKLLLSNTFLVWKGGQTKNFELRASFRLLADNPEGFANSGIQYRSKLIDAKNWIVGGYQADLDFAGNYIGMLSEEKGRGIPMQPGQRILIRPGVNAEGRTVVDVAGIPTTPENVLAAYRKGEWNEIRIVAEGSTLRHYLNGVVVAHVVDEDMSRGAKSGLLALQLHAGQPMTVQFKNVQLKQLP
jgi:hypothetical protein